MKKNRVDYALVVLGLIILIYAGIQFLFYNLSANTFFTICILVIVALVLTLYIRNYKDHHYGGKFKNDF